MKNLSVPLPDTTAEDIFEECVTGYRDKTKVSILMKCKNLIRLDSELYDKVIPEKIEQFQQSSLPNDVSKNDMTNVYTNKFAAEKSPGRKYYNIIREQAKLNICPICGIRPVKNLDHYLPKAKYPTLSVTPNNLIPSCRDCNMDKLDSTSCDSQNIPIHLYFDDIPNEPWLHVTVGNNLEILYYISCPKTVDECIRRRLEKHLDIYKLHELYSSHACSQIADSINMWKKVLFQGGEQALKLSLADECESAEKNDLNSWKSALYRGLINNFDKVKSYITQL